MGRVLLSTGCIGFCLIFGQPAPLLHTAPRKHAPPDTASLSYPPLHAAFSDYLWPTDAGRIVTSTFGEFRRTHFHGGIDISTGDATGFRVFASMNGYVSRIVVSPVGYGKMLFVRHPDGYTTTYAHLKGFAGTLEDCCEKEQQRLERYAVDITCPPGEFPVRRGEVIAYTGDTGIGTPHLHFELRDENLNSVNPLLCGNFAVPDDVPPVVKKIAVTPIGPASLVDGETQTHVYAVRESGEHEWNVAAPIHVTGEGGFEIDVRDKAEGSRFTRSVYRNRLFIDDTLIFTMRMDRAPMNHPSEIGLYYDWDLYDDGDGKFERLYACPENDLPFYTPTADSPGVLRPSVLGEGLHRFTIDCEDYNGNTTTVRGECIVDLPPVFTLARVAEGLSLTLPPSHDLRSLILSSKYLTGRAWTSTATPLGPADSARTIFIPLSAAHYDIVGIQAENTWDTRSAPRYILVNPPHGPALPAKLEHECSLGFVRVALSTQGIFTATPNVTLYEGATTRPVALAATSPGQYAGAFVPLDTVDGLRRLVAEAEVNGLPAEASDEFELHPLVPGRSGRFTTDRGRLAIAYDSAAVPTPVLLRVEKRSGDDAPGYALEPETAVLKDGLAVTMAQDTSRPGAGLYFRSHGHWVLIAPPPAGSAPLSGNLTHTLGEIALLVDDAPPSVQRLSITRLKSERPRISFHYRDDLSGVEYDELKMYIDAVAVIPEVDGEHHRAVLQVKTPLAKGSHQLTIRLKDHSGNASTLERRFVVR